MMNITTGLLILSNPVLALERFQANALMLGILGSGPAIVYAIGCAGSGFWTDRIGFRKMIVLACAIVFLAFSSIFLVDRFRHLVILTMGAALGASFFWPAMIRWLGEEGRGARLRVHVGNYNIALIGGVMVGPLIGGMLISSNYRLPYIASAGLIVAILVILAVRREKVATGDRGDALPISGEEEEEKSVPGFIYIGWAANFAAWFAIGGSQALFPELAKALPVVIGDSFLGVLFALIAGGEIAVFLILRKTDRWHYNYRLLFLFQLLGIGGLLILALNNHPALFLLAFLGIGFAGGMTYFSSIFYSIHKQDAKGRKSGFHESFLGLGVALGPITGGLAVREFGLRAPYILAIVVFAASIIVQILILKKWNKN
jgi:MFS transporter, ACDE family, multidrug resistance protein